MSYNQLMPRVVVIGGGIGGLAVAALLAKDGYQVTVLEKNSQLGGRARIYQNQGYTFDMGPSWYLMPDVFENFFNLFSKKPTDFYDLQRLTYHYRVFFNQHRVYEITSDFKKNQQLFEKVEPGAGRKLRKFMDKSRTLYETSMKELVYLDYESILPLIKPNLLFNLTKLNLFKSFHQEVEKYFKNKDLQKIIEFTTVFLGGSPYNTPAFYTLIAHTDYELGIWYPLGGIHRIVKALESLCLEYGVELLTDQEVVKIEVIGKKASKVITSDREYTGDLVVANADYHQVESNLLDTNNQSYSDEYWEKAVLSPSGFIMYFGIRRKVKNLQHHNLYFHESWEDHFEDVYSHRTWPQNPSYYVHCPSKTDSSIAPPDSEVLMILVPVAAGLEDTDEVRQQFMDKILNHLQNLIDDRFEDDIEVKRIYSHRDFKKDYQAYQGAAFGLAHTLGQTALFRPKNKSRKLKNLYFVGQYTNPGVGMPVVLISAQVTANLIKKDA